MCGIGGYFGLEELADWPVRRAMESLRHRGPDASGRYFRRQGELNVHLFHTRLSILDLDHSSIRRLWGHGRARRGHVGPIANRGARSSQDRQRD